MAGIIYGIVALVVAVAGTAVGVAQSHAAMVEQERALHTQQLENQYNTAVRKNQTIDRIRVSLQTNEAHMAMSGAATNSPSFFAANSNIVKKGDQALRNADTAEALNNYSYQMQEANARQRADLQQTGAIIHGVGQAAQGAAQGYSMHEMSGGAFNERGYR